MTKIFAPIAALSSPRHDLSTSGMASSRIRIAIFGFAVLGLAVQGAPLHSKAAVGSLQDGVDMITKVQERYNAVKDAAAQLQLDLEAAVEAGKLTYDDISPVQSDLVNDVTNAIIINTKLLTSVSNCWMSPPFLLDYCHMSAAISVTPDVTQLEAAFAVHSAAAQRLL